MTQTTKAIKKRSKTEKSLKPIKILILLTSLALLTGRTSQNQITDQKLTDRQIFDIEILSKTAEKEKIYNIIFSNSEDKKIGKTRIMVMMYKYLIDQNWERIQDIEESHEKGKQLSEKEEDIHVGAHLVQFYYKSLMKLRGNIGKRVDRNDLENEFLDSQKYKEFLTENGKQILRNLDNEIKDNPLVIGDADLRLDEHYADEDDDEFYGLDL